MASSLDLLFRITGDNTGQERALIKAEQAQRRYDLAVKQANAEMNADFAKRAKAAEDSARRQADAYAKLGTVFIGVGVAAGIGVGAAIKHFASFDQSMSAVIATGDEAAASQDRLRKAAIDAGATSVYTAGEAADAERELLKANVAVEDVLRGGLSGALNLAAAGQLGLADAASITAGALNAFHLEGDQASHIADLLAAGAGKAQGEVSDLGLALTYVGGPLGSLDVSAEETVGTLALLADNMIIGEKAGTSLRSMIASLSSPTAKAKAEMAALGINVFDAQGKFIGLDGVAGQLHETLGKATDAERQNALGILFGNEALQAATALTLGGADAVHKWTQEVDQSGYAQKVASTQLDNLAGDYERLKGAIDTALIQTGAQGNDVLRASVQIVTGAVDAYNELGDGWKIAALAGGGLVTVVGLLGGAYFIAKPKVEAFRTAVQTTTIVQGEAVTTTSLLGKTVLGLGRALPVVGVALTAGAILLGQYQAKQEANRQAAQDFAESLDDVTGALTDQSSKLVASKLQPYTDQLEDLGLTLGEATLAVLNGGSAYDDLVSELSAVGDVSGTVANRAGQVSSAQKDQAAKARELRDALVDQRGVVADGIEVQKAAAEADAAAGGAAKDHAAALDDLKTQAQGLIQHAPELDDAQSVLADRFGLSADAAVNLSDAMQEVKRQQDILTGATVSAMEGQIGYEAALDAADETLQRIKDSEGELGEIVDKTTGSFDLSTEAGRNAAEQLIDIRDKSLDYADAVYQQTGNEADYRDILEQARQKLVEKGIQYGLTEDAAKAYADQILAIPESHTTDVNVTDNGTVKATQDAINGLTGKTIPIYLDPTWLEQHLPRGPGGRMADQGYGDGSRGAGGSGYGDGGRGFSVPADGGATGGFSRQDMGALITAVGSGRGGVQVFYTANHPLPHEQAALSAEIADLVRLGGALRGD